jgi:nitrogen fixation protein NifU and related proteins
MDTDQVAYIVDHFKNPSNYGTLKQPHISHEEGNPICGDSIRFDMNIKDDKVEEIRFSGSGCAISQAAASILTEMIKYKELVEIKKISSNDLIDALGGAVSPVRLKCALLSLKVIRTGLFGITNWPDEE